MKTGTIGFWSTDNSNLVFVRACANFSIHPFLCSIILVHVFISDHPVAGLHKLWYPGIRDTSTWSKFGAHGEHGDVFLFSNLGAL